MTLLANFGELRRMDKSEYRFCISCVLLSWMLVGVTVHLGSSLTALQTLFPRVWSCVSGTFVAYCEAGWVKS